MTVWYAAGWASIGVAMVLKGVRAGRRGLFASSVMTALSIIGQVARGVALDSNVPGNIVYPIAMGGSVFIVALVGKLFFDERMNRFSVVGVSLGLLAVILISISGS